ncbi:hypothetical protein CJJ23_01115 [Mycoplasmopsis agassizii]|uniref:CinA C-terminal domain-containing protein n=1 Tax=Mycoplasmopsis agassizii TaxID=33922 RepID=A0A269TKE4_9BACT|nr:CinA family protein [Mycoplasmopsis agassizii]PAK21536.1 hypothetical protein CJJ23_01115 [Mycoplasmopsis agassizii]
MTKTKYNFTIATIESMTGGLLAARITQIPGASKYYKGGLITYQNEIKELFNIDTSKGVINKDVALQMAMVTKTKFKVDLAIAITGNAGPSALDNQKVGKVFIAFNKEVFEIDFEGTRDSIREQAVDFVLDKLNSWNI